MNHPCWPVFLTQKSSRNDSISARLRDWLTLSLFKNSHSYSNTRRNNFIRFTEASRHRKILMATQTVHFTSPATFQRRLQGSLPFMQISRNTNPNRYHRNVEKIVNSFVSILYLERYFIHVYSTYVDHKRAISSSIRNERLALPDRGISIDRFAWRGWAR